MLDAATLSLTVEPPFKSKVVTRPTPHKEQLKSSSRSEEACGCRLYPPGYRWTRTRGVEIIDLPEAIHIARVEEGGDSDTTADLDAIQSHVGTNSPRICLKCAQIRSVRCEVLSHRQGRQTTVAGWSMMTEKEFRAVSTPVNQSYRSISRQRYPPQRPSLAALGLGR